MTQVTHVTGYPERGVSQPALDRILVGVDFRGSGLRLLEGTVIGNNEERHLGAA